MTTPDNDFHIPQKSLFDMIQQLIKDIGDLRVDMKAYNGLGPRIAALEQRMNQMEQDRAQARGRSQVWDGLRGWIPVTIGVAGFLFGLIGWVVK